MAAGSVSESGITSGIRPAACPSVKVGTSCRYPVAAAPACVRVARRHVGFTLIEVLVAVLVLSIGLLGLASLQASGIRSNESAYVRSQAQLVSFEIMDRIRADRMNADTFNTGGFMSGFEGDDAWLADQLARLPGSAEIDIDCGGAPTICEVAVRWDDARAAIGGDDTQRTFTLRTRP